MKKFKKIRDFLVSIGGYVLQGLKQMYGYLRNKTGLLVIGSITTTLELFLAFKTIFKNKDLKKWRKIISLIFIVGSLVAFWGVILLFLHQPWLMDIHANEYISRALFVIGLAIGGYDIISLILGTYPGLVIHKMLVNKGSKIPIFDNRTDDPTGKTFGMKVGKWNIKMPRTTFKLRMVYVAISIIMMIWYSQKDVPIA